MTSITIVVQDHTSNLFTPAELFELIWSLDYQARFHYNRSPWVEHGYCTSVDRRRAVRLIDKTATPPAGAYIIELLDTSDQEGALGYHEDKAVASSAHSTRGLAAGTQTPLSKVFCKTSKANGVAPSEVASHEMLESLVDPFVMNESEMRIYTDPANGTEYIGEVGDPVQSRGYDIGAPEGRPTGSPQAIVADFAYPSWWGQVQLRHYTSAAEEFKLSARVEPFQLAPGGYMSIRKGGQWEQIFGSDRKRAEANAHAYEHPGDIG